MQDFLILVASMRRGGHSLAQIAREEMGEATGVAVMVAISS
jgi:carbon starvation protein